MDARVEDPHGPVVAAAPGDIPEQRDAAVAGADVEIGQQRFADACGREPHAVLEAADPAVADRDAGSLDVDARSRAAAVDAVGVEVDRDAGSRDHQAVTRAVDQVRLERHIGGHGVTAPGLGGARRRREAEHERGGAEREQARAGPGHEPTLAEAAMFMAPTFVQVAARLSGTNCGWVRRLEFGAASHLWNGAGALALWLEVVGRLVVA